MQALQAQQPQLKQAGLTSGVAIGTAIGQGITSAISGAINLVQGAISGLAGLVQSGIGIGDMLSDTALKLGVSATSLQLYGEVAKQVGVDTESLQTSFSKLNIKVGEALAGNDAAIQSFKGLGISVQQLAAMSPEQRFNLVADAIGRIPDVAMRASQSVELFGKGGAAIAQSLGDIGSKSRELAQYWVELGGVITNQQIQAAGGIQDKIDLMHDGLDRFKILLTAQLTPYLEGMLKILEKSVKETGGLGNAAEKTASGFGELVSFTAALGQSLVGIVQIGSSMVKLAVLTGKTFGNMWEIFTSGSKGAFAFVGYSLANFVATGLSQFRTLQQSVAETATFTINAVLRTLATPINSLLKTLDDLGLGGSYTKWKAPQLDMPTGGLTAGPTEQFMANMAAGLKKTSDDSVKAAADAMAAQGKIGQDLINAALQFGGGFNNISAAITGGSGSVAADLQDAVNKAQSDVIKNAGKKTNQQLIDERNAWQGAVSAGGSYPIGSSYYPPMVSTPSTVSSGIDPVNASGPPISIQQNFQTGVTAQDLKQAALKIKTETINAVQQKHAAGGTFRNNLKC